MHHLLDQATGWTPQPHRESQVFDASESQLVSACREAQLGADVTGVATCGRNATSSTSTRGLIKLVMAPYHFGMSNGNHVHCFTSHDSGRKQIGCQVTVVCDRLPNGYPLCNELEKSEEMTYSAKEWCARIRARPSLRSTSRD